MSSMTFTYSARVNKRLGVQVAEDVKKAAEGDPGLRREIRRVFQMANRRIQNLRRSGLLSPALQSLGDISGKGYSVFSVSGFGNTGASWESLKREYGRAVAFLNQPTSMAGGAREFKQQMQKALDLPTPAFEGVYRVVATSYDSVKTDFVSRLAYPELVQALYDEMKQGTGDLSARMESDAQAVADALQASINAQAAAVGAKVQGIVNGLAVSFGNDLLG